MPDNTIQTVAKNVCTGCGACFNICPQNAIRMAEDVDGYVYPVVDVDHCVSCGLCVKSCPVSHPQYNNVEQPDCYAMWASDDVRMKSSSGGAFTVLAEWILGQSGIVIGAAFSDDCHSVHTIAITDVKDLEKLRGSKYIQSDTGEIYKKVRELLAKGQKVLFTGTPCQIAAVYSFLGKDDENLYTVDIVCHGVPSQKLWKQFLGEKEKEFKSEARRVSFRDKSFVPWNVSTVIEFADGQVYKKKRDECVWMKSFLKILTLRESCGHCKFAKLPRQGNVTLADFWDIHRFDPKMDDRKGTSLVLVNNEKGRVMLDVLREHGKMCESAPLDHAIKYNAQIKYSSVLHPKRLRFLSLIRDYHYNFEKASNYALGDRYDVGYVGWWYGKNYGSALTNYALNRVLVGMGKSVLMLEFPLLGEVPEEPYIKPNTPIRRFANHFYSQSNLENSNRYRRFNNHCDCFVLGSDQLWNWYSNREIGSYYYFLDFADENHKKIAYATSFGHDSSFYPKDMIIKLGYYLQRFDKVSVRENSGVDICRDLFGIDADWVADPVFLCSMDDYRKAASLSEKNVGTEKYLLAYILDPTEDKLKIVRYAAQSKELNYKIILDGQADFEKVASQVNDANILRDIDVSDWLNFFMNANYVVTDSFHGFCFSIIFRKECIIIPNELRGITRFNTLAKWTGMENRIVKSFHDLSKRNMLRVSTNYKIVYKKIQPLIQQSKGWLRCSLEARKEQSGIKELALKTIIELTKKGNELSTLGKNLDKRISDQINNLVIIQEKWRDFVFDQMARNDKFMDIYKNIKLQQEMQERQYNDLLENAKESARVQEGNYKQVLLLQNEQEQRYIKLLESAKENAKVQAENFKQVMLQQNERDLRYDDLIESSKKKAKEQEEIIKHISIQQNEQALNIAEKYEKLLVRSKNQEERYMDECKKLKLTCDELREQVEYLRLVTNNSFSHLIRKTIWNVKNRGVGDTIYKIIRRLSQ